MKKTKDKFGIAFLAFKKMFKKLGRKTPKTLTYHRKPTGYEIQFGYGATHYRDFEPKDFLKEDGTIKKRIKAENDGLIYTYK